MYRARRSGMIARSVRDAVDQVDTIVVGGLEFRLVVTGTGPVLTAEDGAVTAPLSALAP